MLSSRVSAPLPPFPESEDIFSSALASLFTDDVQNCHGTPGSSITYHSPRFGKLVLQVPTHPDVEDGRKLFAHYLWNAGIIAADAIETASLDDIEDDDRQDLHSTQEKGKRESLWNKAHWSVRGKRVLELGAGTALPSLVAALSGSATTTITDHPSSPALTTGAISCNVKENVIERPRLAASSTPMVDVLGYVWGTTTMVVPSAQTPTRSDSTTRFDRIIVADCLWMPSQHENLTKTLLHYLDASCPDSCALVVAGFHTGREIVRQFLHLATGDWKEDNVDVDPSEQEHELFNVAGRLKALEIFEIDVNGIRRAWQAVRPGETKHDAKNWCLCAVLAKR